jgi:hypothetical protein
MVGRCVTIYVLAPAHIISTNMEISPASCIEKCEIQVTVTWENAGDISDTFIPSVVIDDGSVPYSSPYSSEYLDGGQIVSHVFTIPNLMVGSHKIDTLPPGVDPRTIEVTIAPSSEAGMGLFIGLGLFTGALMMSHSKSPDVGRKGKVESLTIKQIRESPTRPTRESPTQMSKTKSAQVSRSNITNN